MISFSKTSKADLIGILSTSICLVHCIATPLLITFGAGFFTNPILQYLFLIVSFAAVFKATKNVHNTKIAIFLWISFFGFLFSTLLEASYHWLEYTGYFFAILIIVGHILNMRYCKQCLTQNKDEN